MSAENEEVAAAVEQKAEPVEELSPHTALKAVLRTSLYADGLARGLRESVKALDRQEAQLCIMSQACNEPAYVKLIDALCREANPRVPLIRVEDGKTLGEWAGLCRYNAEGKAVKPINCSCIVVRNWGEETPVCAGWLCETVAIDFMMFCLLSSGLPLRQEADR
jgi:small subunit ribosomal protein S12e